ncbi:hypothetical protein D3C75_1102130 [compost metagenome]
MFGIASLVFLLIDGIWLAKIATSLYQKELGSLLGDVKILPAAIFYVLYIIAMIYFVITPNLDAKGYSQIIFSGFLFGVICYATYDLTNLATIKGWSWKVTVIDIVWGGFVTSMTALITKWIMKGFFTS